MGLEGYNEQLNTTLNLSSQIGESMGQIFASMTEGSNSAAQSMKAMAISVFKSMLNVAKASAVAAAAQSAVAKGPYAAYALPALVAMSFGLVEGVLGAVAFADGGIVSGPTLGLVGEYSGARSNPEVIAPLDKLQSMMGGGGSQKVVVEGRIQGTDIVMANERGGKNLDRSRSRTR